MTGILLRNRKKKILSPLSLYLIFRFQYFRVTILTAVLCRVCHPSSVRFITDKALSDSMITAIAVTAYGEGTGSMRSSLDCSGLAVTAGITSYLVVAAFAPLIMAPFSEQFGRRGVLLISSVVFTLCFLPQALAPNVVLVIVFRGIQGAAASASNR